MGEEVIESVSAEKGPVPVLQEIEGERDLMIQDHLSAQEVEEEEEEEKGLQKVERDHTHPEEDTLIKAKDLESQETVEIRKIADQRAKIQEDLKAAEIAEEELREKTAETQEIAER